MQRTTTTRHTGLHTGLLAGKVAAGIASAQAVAPPSPGSGFLDPARPALAMPPEANLVWRAPAVDTLATLRQRGVLRVCVVPVDRW
jgi:hypothetical protein